MNSLMFEIKKLEAREAGCGSSWWPGRVSFLEMGTSHGRLDIEAAKEHCGEEALAPFLRFTEVCTVWFRKKPAQG